MALSAIEISTFNGMETAHTQTHILARFIYESINLKHNALKYTQLTRAFTICSIV